MKFAPAAARRLAICQMVCGAFTALASVYAAIFGFKTELSLPPIDGVVQMVHINPAPQQSLAIYLVMLMVPVGLAVFLLGLAQLRRARVE